MPAKLDRCVESVKRQGSNVNAYAVCNASLKRKKKRGRKRG